MSYEPGLPGSSDDPFAVNPYAPTSNVSGAPVMTDEVEAYRRRFLNHEASVKSIGTLYLLGAIFLVPLGVIMVVGSLANNQVDGIMIVVSVFYLGIGLLQGFAGVGMRRLQSWARMVGVGLSIIGLIGFPIGTLISGYFLYLLLSEKGQIVFSEQYKQVIEQTPHIKYKTSIIVWIFLVILVSLIGLVVVGVVLGGR